MKMAVLIIAIVLVVTGLPELIRYYADYYRR